MARIETFSRSDLASRFCWLTIMAELKVARARSDNTETFNIIRNTEKKTNISIHQGPLKQNFGCF